MNRKYAYAKLTEEEQNTFDQALETAGYRNRTDFYTACAHTLLYGEHSAGGAVIPAELLREHTQVSARRRCMDSFMQILEETAFPIIAVRGIATVFAFLLDDIKRELYDRCGTFPDDDTLKNWLKVYANLNRSRLLAYCDEIRIRKYTEEQTGGTE